MPTRALLALTLLLGLGGAPALARTPEAPGGRPAAHRTVPLPTLTRPPVGLHGHPMWDSWHTLKPFGYVQREYLVSGTATAAGGATAPYTTRIIVFRPKSERRFNGSVLLDWVNVTAQFENAVDSMEAREMLLREGFAFVHVSAQAAGLCCTPLTPQGWDPLRYAAISHPGDQYSFDMFAQVARAMRTHKAGHLDPMGGLRVRRVLAAGQSQSADRLYNYVRTTQAATGVIDGFLIHGGGQKRFPRTLTVPVLHLLSDREASPQGPSNDPRYRMWEVAGTAHSDYWIGYQSVFGLTPRLVDLPPQDRGDYRATISAAGNYGQIPAPLDVACIVAGATMPMHYATSTALHQLDRWVRTGKAPPVTPRYTFRAGKLATDRHHNTRGGIRLPPIEVPVASYRSTACPLGGLTIPFGNPKIRALYPSFDVYQAQMRKATDTAVRRGWLLRPDAADQMRRVCTVRARYPASERGTCRSYTPPAFGG
ncbi:alpha/beta hydrolase domain-containing protein [Nocardioides sp.]|uniref:alpha/beta hydrolase domain-containing protein n=1 Tax=Nocardioides sp. TaxID=35761 RepID=UPI0031FEA0AC|nr:hypothetical protein [Nocardioides sp.]